MVVVVLMFMISVYVEGCYVFISYVFDVDLWWNMIKNLLKQVGEDFNVIVDYCNLFDGDLVGMVCLIEQFVVCGYDGVVFIIVDINVLVKLVVLVKVKGILIVIVNFGMVEQSKQIGVIMYIGQFEYEVGKGVGERVKVVGIKSFVCVNYYVMNVVLFECCCGFVDVLGVDVKKMMIDFGQDLIVVESKVIVYLCINLGMQVILVLGFNVVELMIKVLEKMNLVGKMYFGIFDFFKDIVVVIKKGMINFVIDQQFYLQGYMGIVVLVIVYQDKMQDLQVIIVKFKVNLKFQVCLNEYGLVLVYMVVGVSFGLGFVMKENIEKVEKYVGQYC